MRDAKGRFLPKNRVAIGVPYSAALTDQIVDWLAEGKSLKSFCEQPGRPSRKCVYEWIAQDRDGFAERYNLARRLGAESWADELDDLTASDINCNSMARVSARKNQLAARQWLMSRLYPDRFGDKVEVKHTGRTRFLSAGHPENAYDFDAIVIDGDGVEIALPYNKRLYKPGHVPPLEGEAGELEQDQDDATDA
jgi:hypothetical protein